MTKRVLAVTPMGEGAWQICVKTSLNHSETIHRQFNSGSERVSFVKSIDKKLLRTFAYDRGFSTDDTSPDALPDSFCSLFSPVQVFGEHHYDLDLLHWFGEQHSKRLSGVDPVVVPWLPSEEERKSWPFLLFPHDNQMYSIPPNGSSSDPESRNARTEVEMIRKFRLRTPLFIFGQDHYVFQSIPLLPLLRIEAIPILARIKRFFENPETGTIGHLTASEFESIYYAARDFQRLPVDATQLIAWDKSQHGAVPLLLQHFDPDLLLRMLSEESREILSQEAKVWKETIFAKLNILTLPGYKEKLRSPLEAMDENPGRLLKFLQNEPLIGTKEFWSEENIGEIRTRRISVEDLPEIEQILTKVSIPILVIFEIMRRLEQCEYNDKIGRELDARYKELGLPLPGLTPAQEAKRLKIVRGPFHFGSGSPDTAIAHAITYVADECGANIHRRALENARNFMVEKIGDPVAIAALSIEYLLNRTAGMKTNLAGRSVSATGASDPDNPDKIKEAKYKPVRKDPEIIRIKRALCRTFFNVQAIARIRPLLTDYCDDPSIKHLADVLDHLDRLPASASKEGDKQNESYRSLRREVKLSKQMMRKEIKRWEKLPLTPAEIADADRDEIKNSTNPTG